MDIAEDGYTVGREIEADHMEEAEPRSELEVGMLP